MKKCSKHNGKRRKCWLPAFSPFPIMFSKAIFLRVINSLPNIKILDWSKLKAFADNKMNVTDIFKVVLGRVKNILGKRENAGYQHFLLLPKCFQKSPFSGSSKVWIVWKRVRSLGFFITKDAFSNNVLVAQSLVIQKTCTIKTLLETTCFKRPLFWYNNPSWIKLIQPAFKDHLL